MSRTISVAQAAAPAAPDTVACLFGQFNFTSGTAYYNSSGWNIDWNGHSWLGLGKLVGIDFPNETARVESNAMKVTLAATDPQPEDYVSLALSEEVHGRTCTIYFVLFNATTGAIIDTPTIEYDGEIDHMRLSEDDGKSNAEVFIESDMALLMGDATVRYNNADHAKEYPGDRIFEYLPQMKERTIAFPSAEAIRG